MERYSLDRATDEAAEIKRRASRKLEEHNSICRNYGTSEEGLSPHRGDYQWAHESLEFTGHESEKIKEWVKHLIKSWHDDVKPDYIFVTDTSAIPHGYAIKSAWKSAYPDEETPKFFRINPRAPIVVGKKRVYNYDSPAKNMWEVTEIAKEDADIAKLEFLLDRVNHKNPRIIVFDEGNTYPHGLEAITQFSQDDEKIDYREKYGRDAFTSYREIDEEDAKEAGIPYEQYIAIQTANTSNVCGKTAQAIWEILRDEEMNASIWTSRQAAQDELLSGATAHVGGLDFDGNRRYMSRIDYIRGKGIKITEKRFGGDGGELRPMERHKGFHHKDQLDEDIVGIPIKDSEFRRIALGFIQEIKKIGAEAGGELRLELEQTERIP